MSLNFTIEHTDNLARTGILEVNGKVAHTPAFMPVGTYGALKGLTIDQVKATGAEIILGNTYHLMLRPGVEIIQKHGGLHQFNGWNNIILTDSGGFQVFSLSEFRKITEKGVVFKSPLNGSKHELTPESAISIQEGLGSDIIMAFDECTGYPASHAEVVSSTNRSLRWANRCIAAKKNERSHLFGIIQGGFDSKLRQFSIDETTKLPFSGFALGGLSVGEPKRPSREAAGALRWVGCG